MDYKISICGGANIVNVRPVFGRDSKSLICCSGEVIKVFSVATGECIHHLRGHTAPVNSILINPENQFQIYSVSDDKSIIKWDYEDGVKLKVYHSKYPLVALYKRPGSSDLLATCQIAHKEYHLVSFKLKHRDQRNKLKDFTKLCRVIGRENAVSVGCSGDYAAAVNGTCLTVYSFPQQKPKEYFLEQHDKVRAEFTCVACHPTDHSLATGLTNGKIIIWNNLFAKKKGVVRTPIHWHSLPVKDLCYTTEGSYLLSGGHECVMVKWQHKSQHRDTLPRLGSPIVGVACSTDGTLYATCHSDNSIQVIGSNFKVLQHYQGLTMGYLDHQLAQLMPVGLRLDPRTKALVSNGRPGHLQFYSLHKDKQLFNLDIVCQNYISPENVNRPLVITELENAAFDKNGDWLATIERRDDSETAVEIRLKFWKYNVETQRFKLNTCIDLPHFSKVHTLKFRSPDSDMSSDKQQPMAVTTSKDGKFKLWSLVDDTDIYRENVCWNCESVGFFRDLPAGPADFSNDGSLLAVGFGSTLSLWDPDDNALRHTFTLEQNISHIEFGTGHSIGKLMLATNMKLICFDLLSCSVSWVYSLDIVTMAKSPCTDHLAVFTQQKDFYVFTPKEREPVFHKPSASQFTIIGAIFVPHQKDDEYKEKEISTWQNKCQLYYMNVQQELLTLVHKEEKSERSKIPIKFADNLPETPFSLLLSQNKRQVSVGGSTATMIGQSESVFLKQMLNTPAHVLPPMSSLCRTFMETLLVSKSSNSQKEESDEEEHGADNNQLDSDSDMDTSEQVKITDKHNQESNTMSITSNIEQLHLEEKEFENIQKEQFDWMDKIL